MKTQNIGNQLLKMKLERKKCENGETIEIGKTIN